MKGHAGVFVAARMTDEFIEIRCRLCGDWWPADREFFTSVALCRACHKEVYELNGDTPSLFDPQDSYEHLRRLRAILPLRPEVPGLSLAVRRAYWRERKRKIREVVLRASA